MSYSKDYFAFSDSIKKQFELQLRAKRTDLLITAVNEINALYANVKWRGILKKPKLGCSLHVLPFNKPGDSSEVRGINFTDAGLTFYGDDFKEHNLEDLHGTLAFYDAIINLLKEYV